MYQFTFKPFTLLFLDVVAQVVVWDLNKNFGGSTDLAKERHGLVDFHTPIHPVVPGVWQRPGNPLEAVGVFLAT